uniref:Uncharacterized protein n=1 Tax=Cacopsylla melanoneura TaxID=428564 RepID=A0A8D8M7C3_9HEMI
MLHRIVLLPIENTFSWCSNVFFTLLNEMFSFFDTFCKVLVTLRVFCLPGSTTLLILSLVIFCMPSFIIAVSVLFRSLRNISLFLQPNMIVLILFLCSMSKMSLLVSNNDLVESFSFLLITIVCTPVVVLISSDLDSSFCILFPCREPFISCLICFNGKTLLLLMPTFFSKFSSKEFLLDPCGLLGYIGTILTILFLIGRLNVFVCGNIFETVGGFLFNGVFGVTFCASSLITFTSSSSS